MARPWYGNGPLTAADSARGDAAWSIVAPTETPLDQGYITPRALKRGDLDVLLNAYRKAARRLPVGVQQHVEIAPLEGARRDVALVERRLRRGDDAPRRVAAGRIGRRQRPVAVPGPRHARLDRKSVV